MNAHQRRKERRRIERWCRNEAGLSKYFAGTGHKMAARGAAVSAVETLAAVRACEPGRRVEWWARGGRVPLDPWSCIGRLMLRTLDLLGPNWKDDLAAELEVDLA